MAARTRVAALVTIAAAVPVAANRAANAYSVASSSLTPALNNRTLLGNLMETAFDRIFVLCFNKTCTSHTPEGDPQRGRVWWPSIQERVVTFDGKDIDHQNAAVLQFAGCNTHRCPVSQRRIKRATGPRDERLRWVTQAKHRVVALLSHLTLVEHAAKLNLTSVLIVEADFVRAAISEGYMRHTYPTSLLVAQRMREALAMHSWSVARLSIGMTALPARRLDNRTTCATPCICREWAGSAHVAAAAKMPKMCVVDSAPKPSFNASHMESLMSGTKMCDMRDSAAYAVHRSAYPHFLALLAELRRLPEWLRNETIDVPHIDVWLPHYFDNLYILPPLVSQQSKNSQSPAAAAQKNGARFARLCYQSRNSSSASASGMPADDDEAPLKSESAPPTGERESESLAAEDKPPSTAVPASHASSSTASPLASLLLRSTILPR